MEKMIRNYDAAALYRMIMDEEIIQKYERQKKKFADPQLEKGTEEYIITKNKIVELSKQIFTFDKNIEISKEQSRYKYTGTLARSLMRDHLESLDGVDLSGDYVEVIINLKFGADIMIQDGYKTVFDEEKKEFRQTKEKKMKKLISKHKLRKMAYEDGITINGIKYVNFQRSSSKSRTGNCLFIQEEFYEKMDEWQRMGLPFEKLDEIDLVSSRSYESLTSSSIIDLIDIDPYSILLIDEEVGTYTSECNVVSTKAVEVEVNKSKKDEKKTKSENQLYVETRLYTQETEIWDGQSLLDESMFGEKYKDKGYLLLRNHFFKSGGFNTNIQKYYKEKHITEVQDRFGQIFSTDTIKLVTTKNSCKIFKFTDIICEYLIPDEEKERLFELEKLNDSKAIKKEKERLTWNWYRAYLKAHNEKFGICKYEKSSKYGDKQQLWYQVISSLDLSEEDLWELVRPQVEEVNLMKKEVAFFKRYLDMHPTDNAGNTMMLQLLNVNDDMAKTLWYKNYRRTLIAGIVDKIKTGKIQITDSDFCTIVSNPYEMLRKSAGEDITDSLADTEDGFEVYCNRYGDRDIFGFRSPHICSGNCAVLNNKYHEEYGKYFNFTDRILIINQRGRGAVLSQIWNGSDEDG